jgi:hypothetical protein
VLKGMTEEGVRAPQLAIEGSTPHTTTVGHKDITMADVIATLKQMKADKLKRAQAAASEVPEPFPQKPWKEEKPDEPNNPNDQPPAEKPDPPPPAPRTYQILLTISELTQHYLTSTSPSLRTSLLSLLQTTIPALAKHENSFLPLINTLWPVLLPRLQDPEAYIVANALEVVGCMCEHAGSFMRSRIESAWDTIKKVHRRTQERTSTSTSRTAVGSKGRNLLQGNLKIRDVQTGVSNLSISAPSTHLDRPELYTSTPARMIWDALVSCLCAIASHVALRDEQFEELLDMLDPVLSRPDVKTALDKANADAVWLRLYQKDRATGGAKAWKVPKGKAKWKFVAV